MRFLITNLGGDPLELYDSPYSSSMPLLYRERQHFTQWWLWIIVLGVAAVAWWAFIQQVFAGHAFGSNPAPDWAVVLIWFVIGLGLPFLFETLTLVITVTSEGVLVRFRPLTKRLIAASEIVGVEARKYNAIKEYGGWGIKGWSGKKMAFNVKGSWGVELTLVDGRRILLGTQRPEELAAAIGSVADKTVTKPSK